MESAPRSQIGRFAIIKMSILPRTTYRSSAITVKIPVAAFTELENTTLQLQWRCNLPQPTKSHSSLVRKGPRRKHHNIWSEGIPQSYYNPNNVILAEKQTHRCGTA